MTTASKTSPGVSFATFNPALTADLLRRFIREEVTKAGFDRGVIGLSGGLDSSVVAFLTAQALGAENTYGVLLPYKTSDPSSVSDAQEIIRALGIQAITVDITPMVDAYLDQVSDATVSDGAM